MNQELLDALVEEHLAVQTCMLEALETGAAPSEANHRRLADAFIAAAEMLKKHTKVAPREDTRGSEG